MTKYLLAAGMLIAAWLLLLDHPAARAESYRREQQNGVIFYYFPSRSANQPGKSGRDTAKPRAEVWIQKATPPPKPAPALGKAGIPLKSQAGLTAAPAAPDPYDLPQLIPALAEATEELAAADACAPRGIMLPGPHQLLSLLNQLGYRAPRVLAAPAVDPRPAPPLPAGPQYPPGLAATAYCFPVGGPFNFRDSWGDFRRGGRLHRAVDIIAPQGAPVYAFTGGVIDTLAVFPEAGITLTMRGQDGRGYGYMHLQGFAAGLVPGKIVRPGELIGYVGRTGITASAAHLHFQVYASHRLGRDELLNPYYFLVQLCHGVGVTDLNQPKIARLEAAETMSRQRQIDRRAYYANSIERKYHGKVLVIKNY